MADEIPLIKQTQIAKSRRTTRNYPNRGDLPIPISENVDFRDLDRFSWRRHSWDSRRHYQKRSGRAELKKLTKPRPWLTETAPRGGQGVWRLSLMQESFPSNNEVFIAEKPFQRSIFLGTTRAMVGM